ncbi:carbohydrate ABC transporter permease [Clostridium oryzae]|uniref:Maltose transport system permease protein MalF n=1 Tax=Clostridium oryzae TaxID=1450648 RepID=A0A1V4IKR3_9CLOT|nr:sugar ABC transporter permease [Clostridium oryzae]OPJ60325.1 maltose transport system permease protein MalF [Clostridium oryzae]
MVEPKTKIISTNSRKNNLNIFSRVNREKGAYFFTLPGNIVLLITAIFPVLYSFYLSFFNMNVYHFSNFSFVGLEQYKKVFSQLDVGFFTILIRTIVWTIVNLLLQVILALFLALLLNVKDLKGKGIYRTILILPWAIPSYISALIWKGMFNYDFGVINIALKSIGLRGVEWLNNPICAFFACVIVNVWMATPFMMIVILGGLQSIDTELYEAAKIDGATPWDSFKNITIPLLKPVMFPAVVLTAFITFKQFDIIYLITEGMGGKTDLIITYAYNTFKTNNYSLSAAFSIVIFLILVGLTIGNMKFLKEKK